MLAFDYVRLYQIWLLVGPTSYNVKVMDIFDVTHMHFCLPCLRNQKITTKCMQLCVTFLMVDVTKMDSFLLGSVAMSN